MLKWLTRLLGISSPARRGGARVRATYDAAATTNENSRHWTNVDSLSARQANSAEVRRTLRERARYEVDNNSYADGIVDTVANNLIGQGRRLQVGTADEAANRAVEAAWESWSKAVGFADKLRTMARAKKVDGEAFALLVSNPKVNSPVQLDLYLIEAEQVSTPFLPPMDPLSVDGLRLDPWGNVAEYHLLKYHPGDWWVNPLEVRKVAPGSILHWYKRRRPGQVRGVPEITPALPLFAQHRRFTLATLSAAETAAMFAAVLQTEASPRIDDEGSDEAFDTYEIERGMFTRLPSGASMSQLKAEHPTTTYEMFEWCLLRQICRCLHIPLAMALGDSSKSNFSSARLDHLVYWEAVDVEREDCEREVLDPTFAEWYREGRLIPGYLPPNLPPLPTDLPRRWVWPARPVIDPKVEAESNEINLRSGVATHADLAGSQGTDWRARIRQRVVEELYEAQVRQELGVPAPAQEGPANAA